MIDDLQQIGLFHAFDRLGVLIVIDQDHLFVAIVEDMITGKVSAQIVVVVDDGVAAVTALQHLLSDIFDEFVHIEADQRFQHDQPHRRREIQITGSVHRAVSGDDDRAVMRFGQLDDFRRDLLCPNDDQDAGPFADGGLLRLGVIAQHDQPVADVIVVEPGLCHGDDADLAVEVIFFIAVGEEAADGLGDVIQRSILEQLDGGGGIAQSDAGEVAAGHHAQQLSLLVDDAVRLLVVLLHQLQRLIDRRFRRDGQRRVHVDLFYRGPGILEQHRFFKAEALQQPARLRIDRTEPARDGVDALAALQQRIGDGRRDRVRVRMTVPGDVHSFLSFHVSSSMP